MKRSTMELGGHAPAIVFDDADLDAAVKVLAANKLRNAGQVCVSPTRFLVQEGIYPAFVEKFTAALQAAKVGNGLEDGVLMGPLANERRIPAVQAMIQDAISHGARLKTGGKRIGNKGYFHEPTVLTEVPLSARAMNEEPFGPLALINPFKRDEDAIEEANRLDYGLAAYGWTRSTKRAQMLAQGVETGMLSMNHHGLALPEVHFGGIKDSGQGSEGGADAIEAYLNLKLVTTAML